jgi:outer membrane PBP1 activator LpoA protein
MLLPLSSLKNSPVAHGTLNRRAGSTACGWLVVALLTACAPQPARDTDDPVAAVVDTTSDPTTEAIAADDWATVQALRAGLAAAARPDDAPRLWLSVAEAALIAGDEAGASAALATLPVELAPPLEAWRVTLRDAMDGRAPDPATASEQLASLPDDATDFFRLRWARAAQAEARPLEALLAASAVRPARLGPAATAEALGIAWTSARRSLEAPPPEAPIARGWWALAEVLRNPGVSPLVTLEAWALQWPEHPAQAQRAAVEAELNALLQPPRRIALLLPLGQEPFAEAAEAVRDGVMAAWLEDAANPERPVVAVYSTAAEGVDATYARAVEEGADLVLGPLAREEVLLLLDGRELALPTLALNVVPEQERPPVADPGNRLLQFGLLPEHEAVAAAEYAARQGWQPAALILPQGPWGDRLRQAFVSRYQALVGGTVEVARYAEGDDFRGLVRSMLGTAAADDDGYAPANGNDLPGFLFLAGRSVDVRQLVPYLRYFGAAHLPRATTSLVWTGQVAPDADLDLDGTLVTELPWYLGEATAATPVSASGASEVWPGRSAQAWRLFAFGLDAYRLARHYGDLKLQRVGVIDGATGQLTVDAFGVIDRRPAWAVFRGGRPTPLLGLDAP